MIENLLEATLFGYPQVRLGTTVLGSLTTRRAEALLYYLIVTGRPHSRDKLATLFWPDMPEAKGKKNLRTALVVLRKHVGNYLLISREVLAFDREQPYFLDTEALQTAVSNYTPHNDVDMLATAVAGYRGEFMEGFHIGGAPEFDDWHFMQSQHLHNLFLQGLHILADHYLQEHQYTEGLAITERLLKAEPWSEMAYRQRMLLFAYQQQRSAALKTYQQCQQVLKDAFAITPMKETTVLYDRIRAEETNQQESANPLHNLPRELTSFVGREDELRQIRTKLLNPRYPLVTIIGEGGIGKSRTALTAVNQLLYDFPDGCWFVSLVGVEASDDEQQIETTLALAISQALQITLSANQPIPEQVIYYLRTKKLLLTLDNMEHLINGVDFIIQIMKEAKQVQLLVTSRHRLNLQAEHLFRLKGLPVPEVVNDVEQAMHYASVQLFVARMTQVKPKQKLTLPVIKAIRRICHIVDGLPLGIELAAAQVEYQSCEAIATYLEKDALQVAVTMRDLPPHHRSIWALFDYSWQLLAESEQKILAHCAVFADGFTLEAAVAVAHATEANLTNLVHQSLLIRTENDRYQFHPLLYQFTQKKFKETPEINQMAIIQRHYTYYLEWLETHKDKLITWSKNRLEQGWLNIQNAWLSATQANDFKFLANIFEGWIVYMNELSISRGWLNMIVQTIDAFHQVTPPSSQTDEIYASLRITQFYALYNLEQYQDMLDITNDLLTFAPTPKLMAYAHTLKGIALRCLYKDGDQAIAHLYQGLAESHHFPLRLHLINKIELSIMLLRQGQTEEALTHLMQAYTIAKDAQLSRTTYIVLINLGIFHEMQSNYYQAILYYEEAYELLLARTFLMNPLILFDRWAISLCELGQFDEAEKIMEKSRTVWQGWLPITKRAVSYAAHAQIYIYIQEYEKSLSLAEMAIDVFQETKQELWLAYVMKIWGQAQMGRQEWVLAAEMFEKVFVIYERLAMINGTLMPLAGLLTVALVQKNGDAIYKWGGLLADRLPHVSIYDEQVDDWAWVYWVCYKGMIVNQDPRATQTLQTAYDNLQTMASLIENTSIRKQFLHNVLVNREIVQRIENKR